MTLRSLLRSLAAVALAAGLAIVPPVAGAADAPGAAKPMTLQFGGRDFVHRWSKNNQNEFTPPPETDLTKWQDMVTLDLHPTVHNGDQLAELANRVLGNYQSHGKIVRTASKPRTAQAEAEHLIVAVLQAPGVLEAAFARVVLVDGTGYVVVYSHRIYGASAGNAMSDWLKSEGPRAESALMTWDKIPKPAAVRALPQSR